MLHTGHTVDVDTTERRHHFVAMLGSCWDDARLGGCRVRLDLRDGSHRVGRPTMAAKGTHPDHDDEVDDTGVPHELSIDGIPVDVTAVIAYTVVWTE